MSDTQLAVLILLILAVLSLLGGAAAGTVVALSAARRVYTIHAVADEPLNVPVQLNTDPVVLRVHVAQPDPVTVAVQPIPADDRADIAARILAEAANGPIGPRALARILNVSPSTAQAYADAAGRSGASPITPTAGTQP